MLLNMISCFMSGYQCLTEPFDITAEHTPRIRGYLCQGIPSILGEVQAIVVLGMLSTNVGDRWSRSYSTRSWISMLRSIVVQSNHVSILKSPWWHGEKFYSFILCSGYESDFSLDLAKGFGSNWRLWPLCITRWKKLRLLCTKCDVRTILITRRWIQF